jgi:hypothetical protein
MWTPNHEYAEKGKFKKYAKKHRREMDSCLDNLRRLCGNLNAGLTLQQAESGLGFFSSEGGDLYRIGQSGFPGAKETRLYVYAIISGGNVYVLTIGGKETQQADIARCRAIIGRIRAATTTTEPQEGKNNGQEARQD